MLLMHQRIRQIQYYRYLVHKLLTPEEQFFGFYCSTSITNFHSWVSLAELLKYKQNQQV